MDKSKKEYIRLQKKHRNKLIRIAKDSGDWDFSYLHNYVCQAIRNMYEFYSKPNNCAQCEDERVKTLSSLKGAIDIIDEIECSFKEYYKKYPEIDFKNIENYDIDSMNECFNKCAETEDNSYKKLYTYIGEHIKEWWD